MVAVLCSGVVALRLYGRFLEPDIYGVVLVAAQVLQYLPALDGGFRTTINRELLALAEPAKKLEMIRFSQILYTRLALFVMAVAMLVMGGYSLLPMARSLGEPPVFFLALGIVSAAIFIMGSQMALLVGLGAQSQLYLLMTIQALSHLWGLWHGLEAGWGVWTFPFANLVAVAVTSPLALILIKVRVPEIRFVLIGDDGDWWPRFHRLKKTAWACLRNQFVTMFLFTWDILIAGFLCGPRAAGIYGVLSRFFGIVRAFLQSTGDAAWPIVAEQGAGKGEFCSALLRLNAWLYGATMGAMAVTLVPFLKWYLGEEWLAPGSVVYLLVARSLLFGLSSPASYFLMGEGRFDILARYVQRELLAACVLSIPLALVWNLPGLAWGFLVASAFGTSVPILRAYTEVIGGEFRQVLPAVWGRGLVAFLVAFFASWALQEIHPSGFEWVAVGGLGAVAAVAAGAAWAWGRCSRQGTGGGLKVWVRNI